MVTWHGSATQVKCSVRSVLSSAIFWYSSMSTKVCAVDAAPRATRAVPFWTVRQWWNTTEAWTILNYGTFTHYCAQKSERMWTKIVMQKGGHAAWLRQDKRKATITRLHEVSCAGIRSIACPCGVPPKYILMSDFKWWQLLQRWRKNFRAKTKRRRWRMDFIDKSLKVTFVNGVLALLLLQVKVSSCKCWVAHFLDVCWEETICF